MLRMRSGLESVLVVFIVSVSIKAGGRRGRVEKKRSNQSIKRANAQIIKSSGDVILRFFFCSVYICLSYLQGGGGGVTSMKLITLFISIECHL